MRSQYFAIKACLQLVQGCGIPNSKKLEIEAILFRLMRVALKDDLEFTALARPYSEKLTNALLHDTQVICSSSDDGDRGRQLQGRIEQFASSILPLIDPSPPSLN